MIITKVTNGVIPPCDFVDAMMFHGMDDEWCEKNCHREDYGKCWRHALKKGWFNVENK